MDNRSREPGPAFKLSVVTVGLAAGFGMIFFPIAVLVLGSGFLIFAKIRWLKPVPWWVLAGMIWRTGSYRLGGAVMNKRTANRISGVLGMLASLWAIVMILASNVEAPWKILFGLVAVGLFLSYLLHFPGTGPNAQGTNKQLKGWRAVSPILTSSQRE